MHEFYDASGFCQDRVSRRGTVHRLGLTLHDIHVLCVG